MMTMIHTLFFCILTVLTLGAQAMSQSVVITQTPVDDLIKIELNDIPFAAFEEDGFLHLVLPEFSDPRFEGFSKNSRPSKIQGSGGFLLRLPVPEGRSPVVFGEGEKVHIEFQKSVGQTRLPDHFLTSHILSPSPDGQTALLTIPSKSLVRFYHPKEGRALWTILTTNPGVGLSSRVSKPHMVFLPSLQGLVLKADVTVSMTSKGDFFEISRPGGLGFSRQKQNPLFPNFQDGKKELSLKSAHWRKIWETLREEKSPETLALMKGIIRKNPEFAHLNSVQTLKGMAFLQMNVLGKALSCFSSEALQPSSAPWVQAIYLKNGHPEGVKRLIAHLGAIKKLPQPFLGNIFLLAIQGAVTGGQSKEAAVLFKNLPDGLTEAQQKLADALKKQLIFEPILPSTLEDATDLTGSRARLRHDADVQTKFETILASLSVGKIGPKQALKQLKEIEWHTFTPSFEKAILRKIAALEGEEGHYRSALLLYQKLQERYSSGSKKAEILLDRALKDPLLSWVKKLALFREFTRFISVSEKKTNIILMLGQMILDNGFPRLAHEFLKETLKANPDPEILLKMVEAYLKRGLPREAILLVSKEWKNLPVSLHPRAGFLKAKGFFQEGNFQEALESLPSDRKTPEMDYFQATVLCKLGKFDEAITLFERLLETKKFPLSDLRDQIALSLCELGDPVRLKLFLKSRKGEVKTESSDFLRALRAIRPLPNPNSFVVLKKDLDRLDPLINLDVSKI